MSVAATWGAKEGYDGLEEVRSSIVNRRKGVGSAAAKIRKCWIRKGI